MKTATRLAAALVMAGATLAAGAASAKIVNLGNLAAGQALTIPTMALNINKHYYFEFNLLPNDSVLSQMQASLLVGNNSTPEPIQFSLFSGTPKGTNSFIAQSNKQVGATLTEDLAAGQYYIRVDYIAANNEQASGGVTAASVPEPASWAMLIAGFGMAGYALRRRRGALSLA